MPTVEYGEREIELRIGTASGEGGEPRASAASIAFGYGVTPWWATEIYGKWHRNGATSFDAIEWENRFELTEPGQYFADLGFLVEIERPRDRAEGYELRIGPLLQKDIGAVQTNFNVLLERHYRSSEPEATELGYHALGWAPTSVVITMTVGLLIGIQVMTARAVGEGRPERTGAVLRRGLVYSAWISIVSAVVLALGGPPFLHAIGLERDLADGAGRALLVFCLSLPGWAIGTAAAFLGGGGAGRAAGAGAGAGPGGLNCMRRRMICWRRNNRFVGRAGRTDARLGRCSLAFRLLLAGQTLLDIFGFLLARIKMQHRVALAPLFLHRVCVFCLGCLHRVRVFCFGRRRRWDR